MYKIYSKLDQGCYKKDELIVSQSDELFEKINDKWTVDNYSIITEHFGNRVYIIKE